MKRMRPLFVALALTLMLTPLGCRQTNAGPPGDRAPQTDPGTSAAASAPAPHEVASPESGAATTAADVPGAIKAGLQRLSPTEVEITHGAREFADRDLDALLGTIRTVPGRSGTGDAELRLFGIRPGSLAALLGLQNGDSIRSLDGNAVASAEQLRNAYLATPGKTELKLQLQRRGEQLTFVYRFVPALTPRP